MIFSPAQHDFAAGKPGHRSQARARGMPATSLHARVVVELTIKADVTASCPIRHPQSGELHTSLFQR